MEMPSAASAAATSSCVESGLHPDQLTSAPAARSVRTSTAVSFVTCRQPAMRIPWSGFVWEYLFRRAISTGMRDSAHSIRRIPASASFGSATLKFMRSLLVDARPVPWKQDEVNGGEKRLKNREQRVKNDENA